MERTFDQAMKEDYQVKTTANCWESSRAAPLPPEELAKLNADEKLKSRNDEIKAQKLLWLQ